MRSPIARDSIYTLIGTVIAFVTILLTSILVARNLGPSEYGLYSLLLWLRAVTSLFADFGLSNAVGRFYPEYQGKSQQTLAEAFANSLLAAQLVLSSVIAYLIVLFSKQITAVLNEPGITDLIPLFALTVVTATVNAFLRSYISGIQKFRDKAIVDSLVSPVSFIIVMILTVQGLTVHRLLALDISMTIVQIVVFGFLLRKSISVKSLQYLTRPMIVIIVKYCAGVFIYTTANALVMQRSETFFISRFHQRTEVGFYGIAFNIAMSFTTLVPNALSAVTTASMSLKYGRGDLSGMSIIYSNSAKFVGIFVAPICLGLAAISQPLIISVYGPDFAPASTILRVLAFSAIAASLVGLIIPVFWSFGDSRTAVLWILPNAFASVLVAAPVVTAYGAKGAAVVNLLSQFALLFSGAYLLRSRYDFNTPFNHLVRILGASASMSLVVFGVVSIIEGIATIPFGIIIGMLVYPPFLLFWGVIEKSDLSHIEEIMSSLPLGLAPFGTRLSGVIRAFTR